MGRKQYIRVSELGDFTYCPVAWHLRKNGAPSCDLNHKMAVTATLCFEFFFPRRRCSQSR